jgi:AcrR family transcriptional regulator
MSADDPAASASADAPVRRRDLAVARSLDSARLRSESRVQRFLDAGFELLARAESGKEFTVQEVVDRSGQSLRSFYQYFAGKHELLLALFDEAIRTTAERLEEHIRREQSGRDRLHGFVVEYYRMCLPAPKGRASKNNPTPVMAEFCHQLLTAHHEEASRAFVPLVSVLTDVLDEAVREGVVRPGLQHADAAGAILSTIMFNAAYAPTISGTERDPDADRAAEQIWEYVSVGILAGASGSK